jgi:carbamoyltransferase
MIRLTRALAKETGQKNLCLAGGVALNCVANGKILENTPIREVFVQPAAGDDGGALGAAMYVHTALKGGRRPSPMTHAYLGPAWDDDAIEAFLVAQGIEHVRLDEPALIERVAVALAQGKVVGWFQGRMEYGPRALGNRSILADPRDPGMKDTLNLKVKFREPFRPFAPAVPAERSHEFFELDQESPYMLLACRVRPEKQAVLPSITHVDGTARLQTVTEASNPRFHRLLHAFDRVAGVPVLLNTSFNLRGEPIVCTPEEAYACYARTNMDHLVLGACLLTREAT